MAGLAVIALSPIVFAVKTILRYPARQSQRPALGNTSSARRSALVGFPPVRGPLDRVDRCLQALHPPQIGPRLIAQIDEDFPGGGESSEVRIGALMDLMARRPIRRVDQLGRLARHRDG